MNKIITNRLYLRQLEVCDITEPYLEGLRDPEIIGLTEARHVLWNRDNAAEYIQSSNVPGQSQLIGVFLKDSNKHIGNVRLSGFSITHKRVELGIMLFDKTEWGKGLGTETLTGICNYVFNDLKLHKLSADYYAVNKASAKIFAKAGFEIEGVFKDHFLLDGEFVDSVRIYKLSNKI